MSEPAPPTRAQADRAARQAREAAALRENLRRRRAQAQAKAQQEPATPPAPAAPEGADSCQ